ncbi:hypothetical protein BJY52DRAFT_1308296 [Lactarius psammicola]|nr:hypothetical protein BJY52DRAFT_1308296 [Lactarius psammicola]
MFCLSNGVQTIMSSSVAAAVHGVEAHIGGGTLISSSSFGADWDHGLHRRTPGVHATHFGGAPLPTHRHHDWQRTGGVARVIPHNHDVVHVAGLITYGSHPTWAAVAPCCCVVVTTGLVEAVKQAQGTPVETHGVDGNGDGSGSSQPCRLGGLGTGGMGRQNCAWDSLS